MPRILPLPEAQTPAATQQAYDEHVTAWKARITNMKATLGHSPIAFEVYMQWYRLYDQLRDILGNRLAYLFAYSVSSGSNCPLCTIFFRKIIIDNGEQPEQLVLTPDEQLILDFGSAIARQQGKIDQLLYDQVSVLFTTPQLVTVIAFAGQMIATNIFNNVIETDIDEYLFAYLPFNSHKSH